MDAASATASKYDNTDPLRQYRSLLRYFFRLFFLYNQRHCDRQAGQHGGTLTWAAAEWRRGLPSSRYRRSRSRHSRAPSMITVFLVDDDAGVLKGLSRLLHARGYDVRSFTSPEEFLAQHDAGVPGCAVFDVSMPGLDGLELQAAVTADGVQRPIIFLTGKGDVPTSVRAMKAGAIDFLTKPVDESDLLAAIARGQE